VMFCELEYSSGKRDGCCGSFVAAGVVGL